MSAGKTKKPRSDSSTMSPYRTLSAHAFRSLFLAVLSLSAPWPAGAEEIGSVAINSDSSLAFDLLDPATSGLSAVTDRFGQAGNHVFVGSFTANGSVELGAIARPSGSAEAVWRIVDRTGAPAGEISFGRAGDIFVAAGDVNGDGVADPAVVAVGGKKLRWRIRPGAFTATPVAPIVRTFGVRAERGRIFYANVDGTGDHLGTVRLLPGNTKRGPRYQLRLLNAVTGAASATVMTRIGEITGRPLPVARADGTDLLAFWREIKGNTRVTFVRLNGKRSGAKTLPGTGTLLVGDYEPSAPGAEIALYAGTTLTIYNPVSGAERRITVPASIYVDTVNINAFSNDSSGEPAQCGGTPGICGCRFLDETDGFKTGFVYKAKSETFGGIVAVLPNPCGRSTTGVTVLDTACNAIEPLSDNGYGNADPTGVRHHFKRRDDHTGAYYQKLFGSIILRLEGTDACYRIDNPAQSRID